MEFPANLAGIVFGYDGTNPSDDTLDGWFKRPKPSGFKDKEITAPDAILFFTKNILLVRCNENARIGPDGKYYYPLIGGNNEIKPGMDSRAYQMSFILAMIINSCEQKEFTKTRYFADRQGFNLVQGERGALVLNRFTFGGGKFKIGT